MKKLLSLVLILVLALSLAACGDSKGDQNEGTNQTPENNNSANPGTDVLSALKDPVLNWFMIDDFETGISRLVMELTNPNSVAIDLTVDATFFKDGENVGAAEELYKFGVPAGEKFIIWSNWFIPDADKLDLEFTYLEESGYTPVKCSYQEVAKTDASVTMKFTPENSFEQCVVDIIGMQNGSRITHLSYDFYDLNSNEFCFEGNRVFDSYEVYINCYN